MSAVARPRTESASDREDEELTSLPIVILNAHSRCNCRCVMCDIWKRSDRTEIRETDVSRLLPELARLGVRQVVLGGGEALLHGDLQQTCRRLRDLRIRTTLLSTGLLLARNAGWIASMVDEVIVSLDGPEQVHDTIRGVEGAFGALRRGVGALRRERADYPVSARCVVQKANHGCLVEAVRAAREIGLDRISFLAADVSSEAFNRAGGWTDERVSEIALTAGETEVLSRQVDSMETELVNEFATGYIVESPRKLRERIVRYFRALAGLDTFSPVRCRAPWLSCVVEPNGDVRPCFFHPPVGSISRDGDLSRALNSASALEFRRRLDVTTDPTCVRCACSFSGDRV